MRTRDADILIVPGLGGSGPDHWQSRWQAKLPTARRVEQADWDHPFKAAWLGRLAESIAEATRPVILVAHSLGAVLAADAILACDPGRIAGAFLVAPPSEDALRVIHEVDLAFVPFPRASLPCPTLLIASADDPYAPIEASRELAAAWGAQLVEAGAAGHINGESGHGPWPEGLMTFAGFMSKLPVPV